MLDYRGFQINDRFQIFHSGKQVFTAPWQDCATLDNAKSLIDSSIRAKSLPDRQAALKKLSDSCELENGSEAAERFTEQVNQYCELELLNPQS